MTWLLYVPRRPRSCAGEFEVEGYDVGICISGISYLGKCGVCIVANLGGCRFAIGVPWILYTDSLKFSKIVFMAFGGVDLGGHVAV